MIASKVLMLIILGACLFGLSALGGPKKAVTRPNKAHGYDTVVVSLADGSFVATEQGQGTHAGAYSTYIEGQMDATGQVISGEGYLRAANGDKMFLRMTPAGPDSFIIFGGTGRFEGATGSGTTVNSDFVITVDPDAGTMTITSRVTMEGTITY